MLERLVQLEEAGAVRVPFKDTPHFLIESPDGVYFYKEGRSWTPPSARFTLRGIEEKVRLFLNGFAEFRERRFDPEQRISDEVKTIERWTELGIPCPRIEDHDKQAVLYDFVEGSRDVKGILEEGYNPTIFDAFLDSFTTIRKVAKEYQDASLLHRDPHLKNFLYVADGDYVMAIDPEGNVGQERRSFEEVDAGLSLHLAYRISTLDVSKEERREYLGRFFARHSSEDAKRVHDLNGSIPWFVRSYYDFREEVMHRVRGREKIDLMFSTPSVRVVSSSIVESHPWIRDKMSYGMGDRNLQIVGRDSMQA